MDLALLASFSLLAAAAAGFFVANRVIDLLNRITPTALPPEAVRKEELAYLQTKIEAGLREVAEHVGELSGRTETLEDCERARRTREELDRASSRRN